MDMSTIICFSGFSESPKKKMLIIMHSVMEEEMDTKGPLQELLGRPCKRGLLAPNTKQSPKCAPERSLRQSQCPGPSGQPALTETGRHS